MTAVHLERRVSNLESRIEKHFGAAQLEMRKDIHQLTLENVRLMDGLNGLSRGVALMMEHMGIEPIPIPMIAPLTPDEVEASFDENCR
ncbi:hypothetical protein [Nocardia arthritidis]|uniref:Uncharacterized protein n=1 Tax=Nocardia arthritidis TaxID=228602 RepID=A0A6G9Y821_9NOCA|nr:hypothetical protein [Nocardia arthritidis]QIS09203.1 hypothetical protein F5544_06460 [Nocardia arthritidis]